MYSFEGDLVDTAIQQYTEVYGFDDGDIEFYEEMWYRCYGDRALELCVTLDFLDSMVDEPDPQFFAEWFARFKESSRHS